MTTAAEFGLGITVETDAEAAARHPRARAANQPHYVIRNGEQISWAANYAEASRFAYAFIAGYAAAQEEQNR